MPRATITVLLAATVLATRPAPAGAVDLTGEWTVHVQATFLGGIGFETDDHWSVVQAGTQLTVSVNGGPSTVGTIDPQSGAFSIDFGPVPSPFPFESCCHSLVTGTGAPDGGLFSADGTSCFFKTTPNAFGCNAVTSVLTASRSTCGDGVVDPGEECDAGPAGGVCCSITCRAIAAGTSCAPDAFACTADVCDGAGSCTHPLRPAGTLCRGAVGDCDVAETCDGVSLDCPPDGGVTGPDTDGDGIPDGCDPCTNGGPVRDVLVRLADFSAPSDHDRMLIRGTATLAQPANPPLDPVAHGLRLVIAAPGSGAAFRDVTVPGGAFDAASGVGWTSGSGRWSFVSPVPIGGLVSKVKLNLSAKVPGRLRFNLKGTKPNIFPPAPGLPLTVRLIFDPPFAATGSCAEATFPGPAGAYPSCALTGGGRTIVCK